MQFTIFFLALILLPRCNAAARNMLQTFSDDNIAEGPAFVLISGVGSSLPTLWEDSLKRAIEDTLDTDPRLAPKYLKLMFHDCVGGCDGCVNLEDPANAGMDEPMEALKPIVSKFEGGNITRADIWAMAGMVAATVTQPDDGSRVDMTLDWIGRLRCEDNPFCPNCTQTTGPRQPMPSAEMDTKGLLEYFEFTFGMDAEQAVAILGVHTLGRLYRKNHGYYGPKGWVPENRLMSNQYYQTLLEPEVQDRPGYGPWRQIKIRNTDLRRLYTGTAAEAEARYPDRYQWTNALEGYDNPLALTMLNSDIALARNFGGKMDPETGEVDCLYECGAEACKDDLCPNADTTIGIVNSYAQDNQQWLDKLRNALRRMSRRRYEPAGIGCGADSVPCLLSHWNGYNTDPAEEGHVILPGFYIFSDLYQLAKDYSDGSITLPQWVPDQ